MAYVVRQLGSEWVNVEFIEYRDKVREVQVQVQDVTYDYEETYPSAPTMRFRLDNMQEWDDITMLIEDWLINGEKPKD